MDRISQIRNQTKSALANSKDTILNIPFSQSASLLLEDEINYVLNLAQRFFDEREASTVYRISGYIKTLISNPLFNLTGDRSYSVFSASTFTDKSEYGEDNLSFSESIKDNLIEKNGFFGYYPVSGDTTNYCNFVDMNPGKNELDFINNNYSLSITYPYSAITNHYIVNGGLKIVDYDIIEIGGRNYLALTSACPHNLQPGNNIILSGISGYNNIFTIFKLGNLTNDLPDYTFVIDIGGIPSGASLNISNTRFKRYFANTESVYYIRLFKKIIDIPNDSLFKFYFSNNIYSDTTWGFTCEDIDISNYTDNLNRPITELFLTIIKNNPNNIYTPIKAGIDIEYIQGISDDLSSGIPYFKNLCDAHRIHNGYSSSLVSHSKLGGYVGYTDSYFYGDICEYNEKLCLETPLCKIAHVFNTANRLSGFTSGMMNFGERIENYLYNPHYNIPVKQYSNFISQTSTGDTTIIIPGYAVNTGGQYLWREILPESQSDTGQANTLIVPFTNDIHMAELIINFYLRRQDPLRQYGLHYNTFPSDLFGGLYFTNQFTSVDNTDNSC